MDDLDDRLGRRQRREHLGADRLRFDLRDEVLDDGQIDVGFEQRDAHFASDFVDVGFGQPPAACQPLEDRAKPIGKRFEQVREVLLAYDFGAVSSILRTASPTVLIFSASSSGMSMLNSVSKAMTNST